MDPEQKKSFGPLIGIVVIIAMIVIGGLYFWKGLASNGPQRAETGAAAGASSTAASD